MGDGPQGRLELADRSRPCKPPQNISCLETVRGTIGWLPPYGKGKLCQSASCLHCAQPAAWAGRHHSQGHQQGPSALPWQHTQGGRARWAAPGKELIAKTMQTPSGWAPRGGKRPPSPQNLDKPAWC